MFWSDDEDIPVEPKSNAVDVVFLMKGKTLPNDTLPAIAQSLSEQVENWASLINIGLHLKLGGEEGNGWFRDSDPESVLYLSRRTKLILRTGLDTVDDIEGLTGIELDVKGHIVTLSHKHNKELLNAPTLYSHHVISDYVEELDFLNYAQEQLQNLDVRCKKILCGKSREMELAGRTVMTRSLMLNELTKEDSIVMQVNGFGSEQKRGCGVFVPYKSIG